MHQQGLVAKAEYTATAAGKIYSGIFSSGDDSAIIRLSDADLHVPGVSPGWNPSFAIKFLRDGIDDPLYFNSDTYMAKTREEKMTEIWSQIRENRNIVCQTFGGMEDLFK